MKRKAGAVVKEFLSLQDLSEVEQSCKEIGMRLNGADFVSNCVTFAVEMNKSDCHLVGGMLKHLLSKNIVTVEQAEEALAATVKGAMEEGLNLDVPLLWYQLAQIVAKMYEQLTMRRVVTIASSASDRDEDFRLEFILNVLYLLKEDLSMDRVVKDWKLHGDWSKFTDDEGIVANKIAEKVNDEQLIEFFKELQPYLA